MRAQNICQISGTVTRRWFPPESDGSGSQSDAFKLPSAGSALWFFVVAPCLSGGECCVFSSRRCLDPQCRRRFSRPAKWTQTPVQLRTLWINSAWHMTRGLRNLSASDSFWDVSRQSSVELTHLLRFYFTATLFFLDGELWWIISCYVRKRHPPFDPSQKVGP